MEAGDRWATHRKTADALLQERDNKQGEIGNSQSPAFHPPDLPFISSPKAVWGKQKFTAV